MFIHREDMSGTRTDTQERTNIAEVLIEKHRNGPLGRVELKFDDQKTTFVSLDKTDFGDFTPEAHVDTDTTPF
jgi:replicative DNA helicase